MASALDTWKKRTERDVELPSGTTVTIRLTTVRDEILAGTFAGPVLALARQLESGQTKVADEGLSDEDLTAWTDFRSALIARSVSKVEGEAVTLTEEDVKELPQDDQDELWMYAMRLRTLPKATGA